MISYAFSITNHSQCLSAKDEAMYAIYIVQKAAWAVAALVIVINGYLLLDFFISEVEGILLGFLVFAGTSAYAAFLFYLISRSDALSWVKLMLPKVGN